MFVQLLEDTAKIEHFIKYFRVFKAMFGIQYVSFKGTVNLGQIWTNLVPNTKVEGLHRLAQLNKQ